MRKGAMGLTWPACNGENVHIGAVLLDFFWPKGILIPSKLTGKEIVMKGLRLGLALVLLTSTVFAAKKPIGKIESVKGEAYVAHLLKKKKAATVGEEVFEKSKIKTGGDGEVVIALAESKLTIGPNAYTKISNDKPGASSTKLALYGGKVGFKVNKLSSEQSFTIKTPSAVAGVRGTWGESNYDLLSGTTGASSISHSQPGEDPSIVYTATPENEGAMNDAIRESRENEENGRPDVEPGPEVNVLPEGFVSIHLPDGQSLVMENEDGLSLDELAEQAKGSAAKNSARSSFGDRAAMSAEAWADYLEDLENRVDQIKESSQNLDLPSAPATPQDD